MARKRKPSDHSVPTFHLETLERRILFSADAAFTTLDVIPEPRTELVLLQESQREQNSTAVSVQAANVRVKELVIVDSGLPDLHRLLGDLARAGVQPTQVKLLDAQTDALTQISALLAEHRDLTSVHVMSHDSNGVLELGNQRYETIDLLSRAEELAQWRGALAPDADILLHGYDQTADGTGQPLMNTLARLTGAKVSGSTDLLGSVEKDDDLQFDLETSSAALDSGHHTLDATLQAHHEILFLSPDVVNYQQLLEGIGTDIEIHLLDPERDGIEQIVQVMANRTSIDAIHFVGEGSRAQMHLGASFLTQESISTRYAEEFQQIGMSLSEGADLLIYGCNFGEGESGQAAVQTLAKLTGADVASSDDRTGHVNEFADWQLEVQTGSIETAAFISNSALADWEHALATYTVTNTSDSGIGSFRWAIDQANVSVGADTIDFNIAGSGTQVISLGSALPSITEEVTIDGTTQTGWVEQSFLPIVVDGNDIGRGFDLAVGSDGSEIRGLVLRDFSSEAIYVDSQNNLIAGNWLGQFNSDGSDAGIGEANTGYGITSWDNGSNNVVGGTTAADRNVIVTEGNFSDGVYVYNADNWTLSGNYFGTDVTGNALLPSTTNAGTGIITTNFAVGITVGGATDAHRNIFAGLRQGVSFNDLTTSANYIYNNWFGLGADGATVLGNEFSGVSLFDSHHTVIGGSGGLGNVFVGSEGWYAIGVDNSNQGTVIQGNTIGQNESGSVVAGNYGGIFVDNVLGTMDVTIGGTAAGEGNVIRDSSGDGITVFDVDSAVSIRGNSIFDNDGLGIDLNDDGVTLNDAGDVDTGPSGLQNWAVLNSASIADDGTFTYNLDTTTLASGTYTIDFYASTDRDGGQVEGERFIGTITGVSDGNSSLIGALTGITMAPGEFVTLITTDASGNSSEFSTYAMATDGDSDGVSPEDIKTTATAEGGLSINADGGNDIYLIADDGDALLGGQNTLSFETQFSAIPGSGDLTLLSYAVPDNSNEVLLEIQASGDAKLHIAGTSFTSTAIDYNTLWTAQSIRWVFPGMARRVTGQFMPMAF